MKQSNLQAPRQLSECQFIVGNPEILFHRPLPILKWVVFYVVVSLVAFLIGRIS
jgi:hypothetical protein